MRSHALENAKKKLGEPFDVMLKSFYFQNTNLKIMSYLKITNKTLINWLKLYSIEQKGKGRRVYENTKKGKPNKTL